jgi:large subunit ribosomal protein L13
LTGVQELLFIFLFSEMKTTLAKKETVTRNWYVVDATDQILGRLAVRIANVLRGRHHAIYTPHVDTGDFVIVTNANKIRVTGKKEEQKEYMFYSGYMSGDKRRKLSEFRKSRPEFIIHHAVKGMLPKNRLASQMLKRLKVFSGPEHTHSAQEPTEFKF